MEETYLICEDSLEGVFSGIYEAYVLKKDHQYIHLLTQEEDNFRLFAVYLEIEPDNMKAGKVAATLIKKFGEEIYYEICTILASSDEEKGEAVYRMVVAGLRMPNARHVMDNPADPYIHKAFVISRSVGNEIHHLKEFLRFQELENGILFAKIGPKHNVVSFLMPHFSDRLPLINFIIYDDQRGIFAVHPASGRWYLVTDTEFDEDLAARYSKEEEEYQELFRHFFHKIAIKERNNPKLQRNMLPLRFQEYMVEFSK